MSSPLLFLYEKQNATPLSFGKQPMEEAQKALAKGDYNAAIQHFTSVLLSPPAEFSKSAQSLVLWSRSTCYFTVEDYGRASEDALQILDLPDKIVEQELVPNVYSIHAAAAFRLASANEKLGLSGKAMAYSRMFQSLKKNTTPAAEGLERAEALKKQGEDGESCRK